MGMNDSSSGPLAGLRILDFTWVWAGPVMTAMLADLGAEVLKVESRTRLDGTRMGKPVIYDDVAAGDEGKLPEVQSLNHGLNRNKGSITVNLATEEGRQLLLRVGAISDVVCDNFRPGVMERHGLDYEAFREANSSIVALSLSGGGQWGPWSDLATYAPTVSSLSGLSRLVGYEEEPPLGRLQAPYGDTNAGLFGVLAILHALEERQRTGTGAFIDLSQWEAALCGMEEAFLEYQLQDTVLESVGNRSNYLVPHNNYACRDPDTWISIGVGSDQEWDALVTSLSGAEGGDRLRDSRFAHAGSRREHEEELDATLESITQKHGLEELVSELRGAGVAAAPVADIGQQFVHPQIAARDVFVEVDHPVVGTEYVYGSSFHFSRAQSRVRKAAPLLGESNEYVFGDLLGLSAAEISDLEQRGVLH